MPKKAKKVAKCIRVKEDCLTPSWWYVEVRLFGKLRGYQSQHQSPCKPRCAVRLSITCHMHLKCPGKYVSCHALPSANSQTSKGRFRGSNAVRGGVANDRSRPAHQTCWRIANPSSQNASVSHCGCLVPAVSAGATPVFKDNSKSSEIQFPCLSLGKSFPSSLFIIRKSLHLERSCFGRGQRIEGSGLRRFLALFSCFSAASIKQSCVVSSALKLHEATGSLHRRAQTAFFVAVKGQFSKILHSTSKIHRLTADPSPSPLVDSKLSFCWRNMLMRWLVPIHMPKTELETCPTKDHRKVFRDSTNARTYIEPIYTLIEVVMTGDSPACLFGLCILNLYLSLLRKRRWWQSEILQECHITTESWWNTWTTIGHLLWQYKQSD